MRNPWKKDKKTLNMTEYNSMKEMALQATDLHKELNDLHAGMDTLPLIKRFEILVERIEGDVEDHKRTIDKRVQLALHPQITTSEGDNGESPSEG